MTKRTSLTLTEPQTQLLDRLGGGGALKDALTLWAVEHGLAPNVRSEAELLRLVVSVGIERIRELSLERGYEEVQEIYREENIYAELSALTAHVHGTPASRETM